MLPYLTVFTMMAGHKDTILAEAVRQSSAMVAAGALPTADMVKGAAYGYARTIATQWLEPGSVELLTNAAASFVAALGPRPSTPADDPDFITWRDQFDEHVLDAIGPDMLRDIGQDFVGEFVTDTEIDEPAVLNGAASNMTARLVDAAVKGRNPGQVLAEIGIVAEDIAKHAQPSPAGQAVVAAAEDRVIDEVTARTHVERLVGTYTINAGIAAFDAAKLTETLTLAFDDEYFLALGPIELMKGTKDDVPYFMAYHKASKTCVEDTVQSAMTAAMMGVLADPVPAGKPAKPPKKPKGATAVSGAVAPPPPGPVVAGVKAPDNAPGATGGDDFSAVIKLLRAHSAENDTQIGALIDKTRGTVGNIVSGKAKAPLTDAQKTKIKAKIAEHVAGLQAALTLLG